MTGTAAGRCGRRSRSARSAIRSSSRFIRPPPRRPRASAVRPRGALKRKRGRSPDGAGGARSGQGRAAAKGRRRSRRRRTLGCSPGGPVLPLVRHRPEPVGELVVQILHAPEGASAEEAVPEVADRAFHLALGPAPGKGGRAGGGSRSGRQTRGARVEVRALGSARQHDHLLVVVEDLLRHAPEGSEGALRDSARKVSIVRLVHHLGVERPGEAEDHDEEVEAVSPAGELVRARGEPSRTGPGGRAGSRSGPPVPGDGSGTAG